MLIDILLHAPPLDAGADHDKPILLLDTVDAKFVGAPGTVAGVTEFEADDALPVPAAFVAVTVKV